MSTPATTSVSFGAAIALAFRKYADFGGRSGPAEFWWFILFSALVTAALGTIGFTTQPGGETVGSGLTTLWSLGTLLPTLAVAVRRLRDGGNSWLQLFWLLVPIAGLIVLALRFCDPARETHEPDIPRI